MGKKRFHESNEIDGDPAARQEGFGSEAERERHRSSTAGQSGDYQGLSNIADADSESVEELADEGQSLEAAIVSGVEAASSPDAGEVKTHEAPEDDVPGEYLERDQ
jgi:hypothetical protein